MADRLLLVEDDPRIRAALVLGLTDEGYGVVEAGSGESALRLLDDDGAFDVVLLDLMLPGMDGFSVCRTVRSRGDLPIIMITARSGSEDVVRGLEAGADDYVTKPVVASELAARIRALLRRARPGRPESTLIRAGDVEIHPDRGIATRNGEDVHLTLTELRLLTELAQAAGNVVTREQLLERVWGYDYFGDTRLLDVHVRRLRRKVEDDPSDPTLVLTVRGVGYRVAG
ncbi:MAG TPA: response regulator transcription factor [Mycobacteriales bacterium]